MPNLLFSIRMRASAGDRHISGAERIVCEADISTTCAELINRAKSHGRGVPSSINISIDSLLDKTVLTLPALPVTRLDCPDVAQGREKAVQELIRAGVSEIAVDTAFSAILDGSNPARGAMIIDSRTGRRLEPDQDRGVRARSVDYDSSFLPELNCALDGLGLSGSRIKDALALATKVSAAPSAVAELCISDNPDYITGYVASPAHGYVRITPLKNVGDSVGGRAFFVDGDRFIMDDYMDYMREVAVLVCGPFESRG